MRISLDLSVPKLRPWSELFNIQYLDGFTNDRLFDRIGRNFNVFGSNYVVACLGACGFMALTNPGLFMSLCSMCVLATLFFNVNLNMETADERSRTFIKTAFYGLTIATLLSVWRFMTRFNMWVMMLSFGFVVLHSMFRGTHELPGEFKEKVKAKADKLAHKIDSAGSKIKQKTGEVLSGGMTSLDANVQPRNTSNVGDSDIHTSTISGGTTSATIKPVSTTVTTSVTQADPSGVATTATQRFPKMEVGH